MAGMRNTPSVESSSHSSCGRRIGTAGAVVVEHRCRRVGPNAATQTGRGCRRRRACRASGSASVNSVISVRFVPVSTCTPAALPAAIAASGGWCSTTPSTTGWNGSASTPSSRKAGIAARISSVDLASSASTSPARTPRFVDDAVPRRVVARSRGRRPTTRRRSAGSRRVNSPRAAGVPSSVPTLAAPADSPKTVTRSGSPPNAAMQSRTHSSAAIWSRMPALPEPGERAVEEVGEVQETERAEAVVDRDDDDVAVHRELACRRTTACRPRPR